MAHGTYNNPRAGNNGSKNRMEKLSKKYYTAELRPKDYKEMPSEQAQKEYNKMKLEKEIKPVIDRIATYDYVKKNPKARGYGK
tara:strand:- start:251 stop:499 length:249 start_codon:yes stop_codon:yes gene_type:complete